MLTRIYRFLRWNTPLASLLRYRGVWPPRQQLLSEVGPTEWPTHLSFQELNRAQVEMGELPDLPASALYEVPHLAEAFDQNSILPVVDHLEKVTDERWQD